MSLNRQPKEHGMNHKEERKMKKLFALMLALCLMLGGAALAETTTEITWDQVAPVLESAGITGEFYTFEEIAVAIFIPEGMVEAELPDESYIGYFTAEDGSAIALVYVNADGMDLETYAAALESVGATEIEVGTVNGLPCVSYEMPENQSVNIAFTTEAGYILEVICAPVTTEDDKLGASFVMASIQSIAE